MQRLLSNKLLLLLPSLSPFWILIISQSCSSLSLPPDYLSNCLKIGFYTLQFYLVSPNFLVPVCSGTARCPLLYVDFFGWFFLSSWQIKERTSSVFLPFSQALVAPSRAISGKPLSKLFEEWKKPKNND